MGGVAAATYPLEWEADVLLRDGHPVHLRPITPDDGDALREFHAQLSARTIYFRFFSAKPVLTDADVARFTEVDHVSRVAFVALEHGQILAVGRFDVIDERSAEVAFVVRDDLQGQGLGSILLEHLAAAARERGVTRFVAEVLPENSRMLATFREAGFAIRQRLEEDVIAVTFDIEPTEQSIAVMQAREQRAEARSMARMLRPESVAIVGASRNPGGLGHAILAHLVDAGYPGRLVAVHPEVEQIRGVPCVRSLRDIDHRLDLVVVVVPAEAVAEVVDDAASVGAHGLVVVSGGFGDAGPEGLAEQAALTATARRAGMRLVGPNALGLINTDPEVRLNASLVPVLPPAGRAGFFCQSGALGTSVLGRLANRGVGISTFVSAGNRADVSGNDLLQYWDEDPETDAVLLHLETIGNARKFARLVHRVSQRKPVVMVRMGGARQRHPLGHASTPSELPQAAVDQILQDCGLVVVESIDRLIDTGRVLLSQPLPSGRTVAVVGNSDALAALAENALVARGLEPLRPEPTFPRATPPGEYRRVVSDCAHDPAIGAVLVIHVPPIEEESDADIRESLRGCGGCGAGVHAPVVAVMAAGPPGEVPTFADVEVAAEALATAHRVARWRSEDARRAGDPDPVWEGLPVPVTPNSVLTGDRAAEILCRTGVCGVVMDSDAAGDMGLVIELVDDPLFGMVVSVGLDDPAAALLGDRSYRLAPVSRAAAQDMLAGLSTVDLLVANDDVSSALADLALIVSEVSQLHLRAPGVVGATLRKARVTESGDVAAGEIRIEAGAAPSARDPLARRL